MLVILLANVPSALWLNTFKRGKRVHPVCFPLLTPMFYLTLCSQSKSCTQEISTSFSLHHDRLPTVGDTSFLASAHLPSKSTDSYISHEIKRLPEETEQVSSYLKKKKKTKINHWNLNHCVFSRTLSWVLYRSEANPWSWMIIISSVKTWHLCYVSSYQVFTLIMHIYLHCHSINLVFYCYGWNGSE